MKVVNTITNWFERRTGLLQRLVDIATHPVPPGSSWMYVFGTAILTSFLLQIVTGICLATMFVPSAGEAFESIRYITHQVPFGKLVRGMHFFGASSMVVFTAIHMIRVYLTGSYKFPRELNWLSGVVLFFLTMAMGFTGQALRWDQTAIWTLAVGAEQALRVPYLGKFLVELFLSGKTITSATLSHFFALHVFIFPALIISMVAFHVYLVLHNGISEPPVLGEPVEPETYKEKYESMLKARGKPFWPDAAWKDVIFSCLVVGAILLLAAAIGPPALEKPPDPSLVDARPSPDWYLKWYFTILALTPHEIENWVIIGFPLLIIAALFAVPFISNKGERSLRRRPWAPAIVLVVLASFAALLVEGIEEHWVPKFKAKPLTAEAIGTGSGLVYEGAQVFNRKGCVLCHCIAGHGGSKGPDLDTVGNRLTGDQIKIRIVNGGYNMPSYAGNISPDELKALTAFLQSRIAR